MCITIPGYEILETLNRGTRTTIYRGHPQGATETAIIKTLKADYPSLEDLTRLRHEHRILNSLDLPGILKPLALVRCDPNLALILPDFDGQSLSQYLQSNPPTLEQTLTIALHLTQTLAQLHAQRVIHKDIKPHNILVNPDTFQTKLIDFSISSRLESEEQNWTHPTQLEGTLAYMSPEQTGRMNRQLDYRSDYYSLGITLYQMLAGSLPFHSSDPMEMVHSHIAKPVPPLPNNIDPTVAAIVLKLLSKNAEDRYQSALGLQADLENCRQQLQASGRIQPFLPGQLDRLGQFHIPQKLYGREKEVASLLQAFERVSVGSRESEVGSRETQRRGDAGTRGRGDRETNPELSPTLTPSPLPLTLTEGSPAELALVSGYSGVGKTRIVQEIHKPIVASRGYFIAGKFDQMGRNIPYAALIQAFSELSRQLLTDSPEQLENWKQQILAAVGNNGQVLLEVIPELQLILGSQPEIPVLGPTETQNRFNRVFKQFVQVFAQPKHPLVLFLDDLQWADSASLKLLQLLVTDTESQAFLLIGAYRDNEVSPTHPTILTIEEIEKAGTPVSNLVVQPLAFVHVRQLVAETLNETERSTALAQLLFNKTQGNPFFLTQLFDTLHREELLHFDFKQQQWQWQMEQIQAWGIADLGVVELVARNLEKLPAPTQEALKLGACLGNRFYLDVLAVVGEKTGVRAAQSLWPALQAGLILPLSQDYKIPLALEEEEEADLMLDEGRIAYKFLHDRVQQAAYSLIPPAQKQEMHLHIGQLLRGKTPREKWEENVFDIVNQLNLGLELIKGEEERRELAQLNLLAGRKAKGATAYEAAEKYLAVGLGLLPQGSWEEEYELTRDLHGEAVEVAYVRTEFERAQQLSDVVLKKAKTLLEKVKLEQLRVNYYYAQNQLKEALELGLEVLQKLGVSLPKKPTKLSIVLGLIRTKLLLGNKTAQDLAALPTTTNQYQQEALRSLMGLVPITFTLNPLLFPLTIFQMIRLSIRYGNSPLSAFGYASYGIILCGPLGDIDSGFQFGKLALTLLDEFESREIVAKLYMIFNVFISPWKQHIKTTHSRLLEGFNIGLDIGDIDFSHQCVSNYCAYIVLAGNNLTSVFDFQEKYMNLAKKDRNLLLEKVIGKWKELTSALIENEWEKENSFDILAFMKNANNQTGLSIINLVDCIHFYLFKDCQKSIESAKLTEISKESIVGTQYIVQHNYYYSLSLLGNYNAVSHREQKQYLKQVRTNQKQMQKWAQHAPMNFQHKYDLVAAETARVLGRDAQAAALYDRAIAGAKTHDFTHEEAIANELAGEFYLAQNRETLARTYITAAYYSYSRWGANAKVQDLEERHGCLIVRSTPADPQDLDTTNTSTTLNTTNSRSSTLDLQTLLKASQSLSQEIHLDSLLQQLLAIAIENAGAQSGQFLLCQNSQWHLRAAGTLDSNNQIAIQLFPEDCLPCLETDTPLTLLNYVRQTQEPLLLDDPNSQDPFSRDPYFKTHQPLSLLCSPLLHQSKLTGILYLENHLASGAFTSERLKLLNLLSAQMSISIENALLYGQLQDYSHSLEAKVAQRTEELQRNNEKLSQAIDDLKAAQKQIVAQEKLASLGALTAGVAHEIRNPLNFVTSLATLSQGLTQELTEELEGSQSQLSEETWETLEDILAYLRRNVKEIGEQGRRADGIIQSMLLHARTDGGKRQKTDLKGLVEQAMQLAYHSRKAKDESLNVALSVDWDESIGEVEVFPGQLNRALINLADNALYATQMQGQNQGEGFKGKVEVRGVRGEQGVEIRVRDNGGGIEGKHWEKIFEPFFTTKPPGEGTGLGLSLTYEIVVGQHGGRLQVDSEPGAFTEFLLFLPQS